MKSNQFPYDSASDANLAGAFRAAFADETPDADFMRQLNVKAHEAYVRPSAMARLRRWRPAAALAGVAGVVVIAALALTPTKASAKSFDLVERAVAQMHTFQLIVRSHSDGKDATFSVAGENGRFNMRASEGPLMQLNGDGLEIYDPRENTLTTLSFAGNPQAQQMIEQAQGGISQFVKEFDLKKLLAEYRAKYGDRNITISPVTQVGGRSVYYVTMQSTSDPNCVRIMADASSDLPIEVLCDHRQPNGGWANEATIDILFDQAVDPNLMKFEVPAGAKRVNLDIGNMMKGFGQAFKQNIKP